MRKKVLTWTAALALACSSYTSSAIADLTPKEKAAKFQNAKKKIEKLGYKIDNRNTQNTADYQSLIVFLQDEHTPKIQRRQLNRILHLDRNLDFDAIGLENAIGNIDLQELLKMDEKTIVFERRIKNMLISPRRGMSQISIKPEDAKIVQLQKQFFIAAAAMRKYTKTDIFKSLYAKPAPKKSIMTSSPP